MSQMHSSSFGSQNQGFQVGQNYGSINTEFHLPPERPEIPPKPFATIPFSRDPDFVDRGDETFLTKSTGDVPSLLLAWPSWAWAASVNRSL
ncbi:hypothetical protein QBC43DRAFT_285130 [Cladorrhinum sp. PSN259]|nr:hypothetical protein QBC43DRAFT_285130 [Cladorrhinum sp. PSN259]